MEYSPSRKDSPEKQNNSSFGCSEINS